MNWQTVFPNFPADDMPEIPANWRDTSSLDYACPSFTINGKASIWIAAYHEGSKFTVAYESESGFDIFLETDDFQKAQDSLYVHSMPHVDPVKLAKRFSAKIRAIMTREELKEIRRRNRDSGYGCATHDFCDANMPMYDAFCELAGRDILDPHMRDDDMDTWNAAWDIARKQEFRK